MERLKYPAVQYTETLCQHRNYSSSGIEIPNTECLVIGCGYGYFNMVGSI